MTNYTQEELNYFCGDFDKSLATAIRHNESGWIPTLSPVMSTLYDILSRQQTLLTGGRLGLAEGDYCE